MKRYETAGVTGLRKKGIAAAALLGLALRLAVLAGAGEDLGRFVNDRWGDGNLVRATLNIELGARGGAPEGEPAAEPDPAPPEESAAPTAEPSLLLVEVTPRPAPSAEPAPEEAPEPPAPEVRAADLSGGAAVNDRTQLGTDLAALAAEGLELRLPAGGPQVLIIHTHSSEAYTPDGDDRYVASDPYRTEDKTQSVIRVGDAMAAALEAHGLTVLHDREIYDYPSYTGSYGRSGAAVERCLAENPTLRVVIDLHRDALGSGDVVYKTQAAVRGQSCAQVMLLAGTGENGLPHPNWRENLKLAMYLQDAADAQCPTLMRPIELVSERYNQQLCPGMLIAEVGSTGNTLREAITAAELFGDAAGAALARLADDPNTLE